MTKKPDHREMSYRCSAAQIAEEHRAEVSRLETEAFLIIRAKLEAGNGLIRIAG
jgi:hypothetical protein